MTIIGIFLLAALLGLSIFQLILIAGKPLGEYAWGGQHKVLPNNLRRGSIFSLVIYALMALVFIDKSGFADTFLPDRFVSVAMWVITGYFALGIVMNGISRSKKERNLWTPIVIVLSVLSFLLARG